MAYKDLMEYYNYVCGVHSDMKKTLEIAQEQINNNIMTEDQIKVLLQQFEPIRARYQEWTYMKYLMDMPVRKNKKKTFTKQNAKRLASIDPKYRIDNQLIEDRKILEDFREQNQKL